MIDRVSHHAARGGPDEDAKFGDEAADSTGGIAIRLIKPRSALTKVEDEGTFDVDDCHRNDVERELQGPFPDEDEEDEEDDDTGPAPCADATSGRT